MPRAIYIPISWIGLYVVSCCHILHFYIPCNEIFEHQFFHLSLDTGINKNLGKMQVDLTYCRHFVGFFIKHPLETSMLFVSYFCNSLRFFRDMSDSEL